jgi:hypothetical protein
MTPMMLITVCRDRGVVLTPTLEYDGPEEALVDDLVAGLRAWKPEVLRLLALQRSGGS